MGTTDLIPISLSTSLELELKFKPNLAFEAAWTIFWVWAAGDPTTVMVGVIVMVGVVSVAGLTVTVTASAVTVTVAGGVYVFIDKGSL